MRVSHIELNSFCKRVRAAEHAPRGPSHVLERRHGIAEVVERGGGVLVERLRVTDVARLALRVVLARLGIY